MAKEVKTKAKTNGKVSAKETEARIEVLLNELTLDEKIRMIHASEFFKSGDVPRLNIPKISTNDGPMGVRNDFEPASWDTIGTSADLVSYMPSNTALASTWNRELAKNAGLVLGEEARGRGKDMILAPGINIKRNPLCGRNFEYMSEDPYLIAEMVVPLIEGIQKSDVSACVKHFACNAQETNRLWVNVELDERTLREIYLPGFEAAVKKAKTHALMGAYNLFRGEHASQNKELLTDILRDEWGYDGLVVSDWGAVHETIAAAKSGLDIEMSVTSDFQSYFLGEPLKKALEEGTVSVEDIDKKVRNIIRFMLRVRMIEIGLKETAKKTVPVVEHPVDRNPGCYDTIDHHEKLLAAARESIVLLKNEKKRLPLDAGKTRKILVVGANADKMHANGGGSAEIKALYEVSPLLGITKEAGGNVVVKYVPGYYVRPKQKYEATEADLNIEGYGADKDLLPELKKLYDEKKGTSAFKYTKEEKAKKKELLNEAVALAKEYDDVIIVGGLDHDFDVEGQDRTETGMKLPYDQDILIEEVLKVNPKAVVVMMAGSPVDMRAWSDKAQAILWMSYNGMEGGTALGEVIFGKVNPSGKLPETLPDCYEDTPVAKYGDFPGRKLKSSEYGKMNAYRTQTFREGIFVGYRYYDTFDVPVQYCFGHGLSYTQFKYSALSVTPKEGKAHCYEVSFTLKNTGRVDGKEAVQVYVGEKDPGKENPKKELKAFDKIYVKAGEEKKVTLLLTEDAFKHYDEKTGWYVREGQTKIYVGASVADIRLMKEITV